MLDYFLQIFETLDEKRLRTYNNTNIKRATVE